LHDIEDIGQALEIATPELMSQRSKGKCEARATGNELEGRRTMGERKRRGKAFSPSLCPLRALVPQKKTDVWE